MNKKTLSERDICTKYIAPALKQAGWDEFSQIREEVGFTKGHIIGRGRLVTRGKLRQTPPPITAFRSRSIYRTTASQFFSRRGNPPPADRTSLDSVS